MIKSYIDKLNYKSLIWLIVVYCIVAALIVTKGVLLLPYFLICATLYYIIYKHPISAILILLIILYPMVFQMTPSYKEENSLIGGGLRAEDVVLVLMGFAIIQKLLQKEHPSIKLGLEKIVIFFFLLLSFNIIRNVNQFGIASFGEFRFYYLILVLPVYVSLFFDTIERRKQLFLALIFLSIIGILLSVPFIVAFKGWSIGTENDRFLSSQITLGLVYGVIALLLASKYNLIKIPRIVVLIITIPTFILLVADSHRSVWLALIIAIFSLYKLKEIKIKKMWKWSVWILILILITYTIFQNADLSLITYVKERLIAFTNPKDDPTAFWRLAVWDASLKSFLKYPLFGQGFGGYWYLFVPELNSVIN